MAQSKTPTREEALIDDLARHVRLLHRRMQGMGASSIPWFVVMLVVVIVQAIRGKPAHDPVPVWALVLMMLSMLAAFFYMVVQMARTQKACRRFNALCGTGLADIRANVSPAAIGPLLDITLSGSVNGEFLNAPTELLGGLLRSLRAGDDVPLTPGQRNLLHELVCPSPWYRTRVSDGPGIAESVRREIRPVAVRALGLLGNRESLPVLERLAHKTSDPELKQLALASADQIRERLQYGPGEMLRPAGVPEVPETLLRAASSETEHDTARQQLLRADVGSVPKHSGGNGLTVNTTPAFDTDSPITLTIGRTE